MLRFAKPGTVRALLMAAAVALAVPVAGGLALTAEGKRARALNRPLEGLPALAEATGDPAGALRRLGDYAGDRALGVVGAGTALARLRYALGDPGAEGLVRDGDMVFVTDLGGGPRAFEAMRWACRLSVPEGRWVGRLADRVRVLAEAVVAPGRRMAGVVVPSKPVLYADRLPPAVPAGLRRRCTAAATDGWLADLRAETAGTGVTLVDGLPVLAPHRGGANFYPPQNFHTAGASAHLAGWALLDALAPGRFPPGGPGWREGEMRADLRNFLPFERRIGVLRPRYGAARATRRPQREQALAARFPEIPEFRVYTGGGGPRAGRRALVLGNSFSLWIAPHIATGFDETVLVFTNGLKKPGARRVLEDLLPETDPDAVLLVYHEAGWKNDQNALGVFWRHLTGR